MVGRLLVGIAVAVLLVGCGGGDSDSDADDTVASQPSSSADDTTSGGGSADEADNDGTGVANLDLDSLGAPPDADPQSAVATIDGETFVFDAADLGAARCEVSSDGIAVNIGQSEDWFSFVATASGDTWSAGPMFGLEDGPQYEGLTPGSRVVVSGDTVTYQGEIVVKIDPVDFASWERTLGSMTVNCADG